MVKMYGGWDENSAYVKRIHKRIAHKTGLVAVMKVHADRMARDAEVRLNAAKHRTGASKIVRSKGKLDEYVELQSPGGFGAVIGIEYGRAGEHGMDGLGPLRGAANAAVGRHRR